MPAKPMLDDIELQLVQDIEAEDEEALAQHGVPVLEGDFLQDLGRRASRVSLTGVMIGEDVADALKKLRDKFRSAEPVPFRLRHRHRHQSGQDADRGIGNTGSGR